jgi:hypothetical protein
MWEYRIQLLGREVMECRNQYRIFDLKVSSKITQAQVFATGLSWYIYISETITNANKITATILNMPILTDSYI